MKLWRLTVSTTSEAAEAVATVLEEAGFGGAEVVDEADIKRKMRDASHGEWFDPELLEMPPEGAWVRVYVQRDSVVSSDDAATRAERALLPVRTSGLHPGSLGVRVDELDEAAYVDLWKMYFHAVDIGGGLTVVPIWEAGEWAGRADSTPIWLDPGMAFGTGAHESTVLCLRELPKWIAPGATVLDVGAGTGILSVTAAKLGARRVLAVDLDPRAVETAVANAELNGAKEIVEIRLSDLLQAVSGETFDVVAANLLVDLLVTLAPDLPACLAPGGVAMLSGFVAGQRETVRRACERAGLVVEREARAGDWVLFVVRAG